jgi:hypothetical protein
VDIPLYCPVGLPNLSPDHVTINHTQTRPAAVTVSIFSSEGSLIKTLFSGTLPSARHSFYWNGLSDCGVPAPRGNDLIKAVAPAAILTRKITTRPATGSPQSVRIGIRTGEETTLIRRCRLSGSGIPRSLSHSTWSTSTPLLGVAPVQR